MSDDKHDTKNRLLDAAEQLFLSKGFETVSIRELAAAADVNVAAVNYHFQGKDNLYREVIKRRFTSQRDRVLGVLDQVARRHGDRPPLEDVIRSIVSLHLHAALSPQHENTVMCMVVRELHSNTSLITPVFLNEMVRPLFRAFSEMMIKARPSLAQAQIDWIVASIVGQIQHFIMRWHKSRQLLESEDESVQVMLQAFPALGHPVEEYIEQVTDHITRFSTAAIDALHPEVSS